MYDPGGVSRWRELVEEIGREPKRADGRDTVVWAAGILEGEGWFTTSKIRRQKKAVRYEPAVGLDMTDRDIVSRVQMVFGRGKLYGPYDRVARKPKWRWQVLSYSDIEHVLDLVEPWLGLRRIQQAHQVRDCIFYNRGVYYKKVPL